MKIEKSFPHTSEGRYPVFK